MTIKTWNKTKSVIEYSQAWMRGKSHKAMRTLCAKSRVFSHNVMRHFVSCYWEMKRFVISLWDVFLCVNAAQPAFLTAAAADDAVLVKQMFYKKTKVLLLCNAELVALLTLVA